MDMNGLSKYLLAMAICHELIDRKLLRLNEFRIFEKQMCEKYGLPSMSIFRDKYVILANHVPKAAVSRPFSRTVTAKRPRFAP